MKSIKCAKCGRVLGKLDDDKTFHIRIGKDGPQVFVRLHELMESFVMLVCPSFVYTPAGRMKCGNQSVLGPEVLN